MRTFPGIAGIRPIRGSNLKSSLRERIVMDRIEVEIVNEPNSVETLIDELKLLSNSVMHLQREIEALKIELRRRNDQGVDLEKAK